MFRAPWVPFLILAWRELPTEVLLTSRSWQGPEAARDSDRGRAGARFFRRGGPPVRRHLAKLVAEKRADDAKAQMVAFATSPASAVWDACFVLFLVSSSASFAFQKDVRAVMNADCRPKSARPGLRVYCSRMLEEFSPSSVVNTGDSV